MSELVEFLLARIAEDEEAAQEALALASIYEQSTVEWHWLVSHSKGNRWEPTRHDPTRVLRECEAKRQIIEAHPHQDTSEWDSGLWCHTCQWDTDCDMPMTNVDPDAGRYPCVTLKALATVYADHGDFREEWS